MAHSRYQFRLSTLLWITLAVACWFGGRECHRRECAQEQALLKRERYRLEERLTLTNLALSGSWRTQEYYKARIKELTGGKEPPYEP